MINVDVEQLPILQEKLEETKSKFEQLAEEANRKIRSTQRILDDSYEESYIAERNAGYRLDEIDRQINNFRYSSSYDDDDAAEILDSLNRQRQECQEEYWAARNQTSQARRRRDNFTTEISYCKMRQAQLVASYFDTINKSNIFLEKYRTLALDSKKTLENQPVESQHEIPDAISVLDYSSRLGLISRYSNNDSGVIDVHNPFRASMDLEKAKSNLRDDIREFICGGADCIEETTILFREKEIFYDSSSKMLKLDIQRFAIHPLEMQRGFDYFDFNGDEYTDIPDEMKSFWKSHITPENYNVKLLECDTRIGGEKRVSERIVYQMADFDPYARDKKGRTNIERIKSGRSPVNSEGRVIHLHHLTQDEPGTMLEIAEDSHTTYSGLLHGLKEKGESFRNNRILNRQFKNFERQYWTWRLNVALEEKNERR